MTSTIPSDTPVPAPEAILETNAALLAEIERLRAERDADHRTWQHDLSKLREAQGEVERLRNRLHSAAMTRTWRLENGKQFVYVEDIAPHLLGTVPGGAA
ncbi:MULTISPECIES: hypothetical protein [Streptomyces]|uniref:Uncharacterized protein n=2 Tax=Streptomyces rimosus subsp. rimosus TaxID=132474 RepID=L8F222_STRR1|nr:MULTISPECIES: hypothetical protein [Streptomyces]KOG70573.1 hypothetical protein ADK78_28740 [Kitasatospora aureofaciens]MYT47359.1 hypothetical protein [Streptomyces sp. SID5471]KEF04689.1 hypothetical protein DF17_22640 [Streptomyces rimosus]KEF19900.1 hypothetical protein DF18_13730 [Streptomyces rimosus]KOT31396.1 hypothetical protein ADK84_30255 [Streptomyces sp. NRRL WC-3701]